MTDIRNNIDRQPESLRQIDRFLSGAGASELEAAAELLASSDRIIFTGMGGSLYGLMPAATYLARHGVMVNLADAGELLYYSDVPKNAVIVAMSRSGRTAEVVRLSTELKSRGVRMVGLTNCPASELGKSADLIVPIAGDLDHGVSIQTYTGGILTSLYLAARVSGTLTKFQHDLATALDIMESRMAAWWACASAWRWEERAHFYFLGRGYSISSACEATLLMQELARRTASWYSAAEFRQGPVEALRRGHAVVIFAPDGETQHLNRSLVSDLARTGCSLYEIGGSLGVPEYLAPLLQIIPVQMAAYKIAASDQETPGLFRFAAAVSDKEDGLATG